MAYLKIFPIKVTDKKALDYITNPDKTDEKLLVSSFGCSPETADLEFSMTREMAKKNGMDKGDNLAFHLIQSFKPGEVDAENAHRLGQQFADEVLKGKYEYVISTHVDKNHIHNHIIFNAAKEMLKLCDVALHYKERSILHNINISATKGEVIGVVGHNGAGKTTFSRAICGLHKDCEGQFLWEGKPMDRKARLKRSYMVMQDVNYELFADSVEAECSFGIRNPDQTLINATLEELGLAPYRERHPNTLSGGQKQRVAVAVSMICGKDLLVFDEPTSGLDFDSMTQVAGLIRRLSNMGKVIFIVTHDFEFVCRTCSRVLHFDEGEMPDDVQVTMDALPKLRELFSVSDGKER